LKSVFRTRGLIFFVILAIGLVILMIFFYYLYINRELDFSDSKMKNRMIWVFIMPVILILLAHFKLLSITINEEEILVKRFFQSKPKVYRYNDISQLKGASFWISTVNYDSSIICFKDGNKNILDSYFINNYLEIIERLEHIDKVNRVKED